MAIPCWLDLKLLALAVSLLAALPICRSFVPSSRQDVLQLLGWLLQRPLGRLQLSCLRWLRHWRLLSEEGFSYVDEGGILRQVDVLPVQPPGTVRCVCISDTHLLHRRLLVPPGDLLLHAGDVLLESHGSDAASLCQLADFNKWLEEQPHKHKVCIAGNHDGALEALGAEEVQRRLAAVQYLQDATVEVAGLRVHGCPLSVGTSPNKAFQPQGGYKEAEALAMIPEELDILLTHGPGGSGKGTLGRASALLERRVCQVRPRYHVFGHWHPGWGAFQGSADTVFINASSANVLFAVTHPPIIFDVRPRERRYK